MVSVYYRSIHHCNISVYVQVQELSVIAIYSVIKKKKAKCKSHFFTDACFFDSCYKIYI